MSTENGHRHVFSLSYAKWPFNDAKRYHQDKVFYKLLWNLQQSIDRYLPAFAESLQLQLADKCGKGTSAGFAEAGALGSPTSVGGAPLCGKALPA
jgi:hypothetical protein